MKTLGAIGGPGRWITPCLVLVVVCCVVSTTVPVRTFGEDQSGQTLPTGDAFEQNRRLGRGVNILGYDPIWKSRSDARFREEYFRLIRQAGFDHVRINLHPFRDARADGSLGPSYWAMLDWAVKHALDNHLAVILDVHEHLDMGSDPLSRKQRFLDVWRQIAQRYRNAPREVYFEILNEPNEKLTPALWNQFFREALAIIRTTNPGRTVIVGPGQWNGIEMLDQLDLPADDRNLIVTVHYYNPFSFTHQGAFWTEYKNKVGVAWTGTEQERQAIVGDFDRAQAWAKKHSRPLYLGEFGVYDRAEMSSRVRYLDFVARQAEKRGWSWAYWQFDSDFLLYDVSSSRWVKPVLDALIPPKANQNLQDSPP